MEKSEARKKPRGPKQIRMSKMTKNSKQPQIGFEVLDCPGLGFILVPVCFEFRYSDFGFSFRGVAVELSFRD
jgi:hypothetical protein